MADLPVGAYRGGSLDCQIIYDKDDLPIGFSQRGVETYFPSVNTNPFTGGKALPGVFMGPAKVAQTPYRLASFGDSRANVNSSGFDVTGSTLSPTKTPSWIAAIRKDMELSFNFGVSGDPVTGWALATRNGGVTTKPFQSFIASGADAVHIQDGVNDILTGNGTTPTAATITAAQKALVLEAMKSGICVLFESILPCTAAGWTSAGSGTAAQKQAIADQCNAIMQDWMQQFPSMGVFIDTASGLKDATGFANPALYVDQIHLNPNGARQCGKLIADASVALLPKKLGIWFPSGIVGGANFIDLISPNITNICMLAGGSYQAGVTNITGQQVAGSMTLNRCESGFDANGPYIEYSITPTALASGEATFWTVIGGDVGSFGGATPKYSITSGDALQGQCRIIVDDGAGNTPPGLSNIVVRQRIFYQAGGGSFADWGAYSTPSTFPVQGAVIDQLFTTPRLVTTAGSIGLEPSTHAKGLGLHIFVSLQQVGTPVRFRVYAPSLRKAA